MSEVRLRPVHVVKLGRWRLNWRVGRYGWGFDWAPYAVSVLTPRMFVSVGKVLRPSMDEEADDV